jgi:hypothetical protein
MARTCNATSAPPPTTSEGKNAPAAGLRNRGLGVSCRYRTHLVWWRWVPKQSTPTWWTDKAAIAFLNR